MQGGQRLGFDAPGWRMAGSGGFRQLPGGVIESYGGPGLLWYVGEVFQDFGLSVAWRIARLDDNSGVFLRAPALSADPQPAVDHGYEVQIDDRGLDPERGVLGSPLHLTGSIYRLAPARQRCSHAVGAWNVFEIIARGPAITVRLNGRQVSALLNGSRELQGHVALQAHHEGSAVQFRDLRIWSLKGR
jgi:Domain of Unknown Function (DUF1080)